ncbi:hypothetical protein FOLKNPGA_01751 [Legionella sp. PC1000]|uniref:hypothetical protein n=1 Tax=Legionella sp. PC1000 TaxID=2746060 RepID=UPI0015FDC01F|nr:hypothetical protein [Legionella sp. PC1000]QLZ68971.1 hypothetical protein FOLKNPGA_01751 [Legionella sp. PC1000]
MINIGKNRKLKLWLNIFLFVLLISYISLCLKVHQSRNELYSSRISLRLMSFCNQILQDIYGQYLGPSRDDTTKLSDGTYRQKAEVYFPGLAPQNVSCFIQQDKTWIGYNAKTKVYINLNGVNYAPTWFDQRRELKYSVLNITLEELDKKYIAALSIKPTKKPTFRFLSLSELIYGVSYLDV